MLADTRDHHGALKTLMTASRRVPKAFSQPRRAKLRKLNLESFADREVLHIKVQDRLPIDAKDKAFLEEIWTEHYPGRPFPVYYPRLKELGIEVHVPDKGHRIEYVLRADIQRVLTREGKFSQWCNWAAGSTSIQAGVYPHDLERFLEGLPNND